MGRAAEARGLTCRHQRGAVLLAGLCVVAAACEDAREAPPHRSFPTHSETGAIVHWARREILLVPLRPAAGADGDDLDQALREGARAWNRALGACTAPRLRVGQIGTSGRRVGEDGVSTVGVRARAWCPDGARGPEDCYGRERLAVTHIYPHHDPGQADDGELREADVEINAVSYRWSLRGDVPGTRSLRDVLVHELGHVLGLDHSCWPSGTPVPASFGQVGIPSCTDPGASRSVMYPATAPAFEGAQGPGRSEADALCAVYAAARRRGGDGS